MKKIPRYMLFVISMLTYALLLYVWIFTDKILTMETNDLLMYMLTVIVGILFADKSIL